MIYFTVVSVGVWLGRWGLCEWSTRVRLYTVWGKVSRLVNLWTPQMVLIPKSAGLAVGQKVRGHQRQTGTHGDKVKPCLSLITSIFHLSGTCKISCNPLPWSQTHSWPGCRESARENAAGAAGAAGLAVAMPEMVSSVDTRSMGTFKLSESSTSALLTLHVSLGEP